MTFPFFGCADGYVLRRADATTFSTAWAVYRQINEDFTQSLVELRQELAGVPCAFWLEKEGQRYAGVVALPNRLGDLFLVPPHNDMGPYLDLILPVVRSWSERQLTAEGIAPQFVAAFEQLGFSVLEQRQFMVAPTRAGEPTWSTRWQRRPVTPDDAASIADLLYAAFRGGVGQYGRRDKAAHRQSVDRFMQQLEPGSRLAQSSLLVTDGETGQPAGVILVNRHKQLPTIQFVAVTPAAQGRGLATTLIRHASHTLHATEPYLKLAVTLGNPAVQLYTKLGFVAGDVVTVLREV